MASEEEVLTAMVKRLELIKGIDDVRYPQGDTRELSYHSPGWHGYWIRFRFNRDGEVIESAAGC